MGVTIFWGDCLRSARVAKKLTQKEVASILHISRQTYSCYETGRSQPTPEILAILSNIYDINLLDYALQCMPEEYVAEQQEFKYSIPSRKAAQSKETAAKIEAMKRKKQVKYKGSQTENRFDFPEED